MNRNHVKIHFVHTIVEYWIRELFSYQHQGDNQPTFLDGVQALMCNICLSMEQKIILGLVRHKIAADFYQQMIL